MSLTKAQAISMLSMLFDDNKLSFRDIKLLKSCFDEAVEATQEQRSEAIADWQMGRAGKPQLPDIQAEDNFWYNLEVEAAERLRVRGVKANPKAIAAIAEVAAEIAEFDVEDML